MLMHAQDFLGICSATVENSNCILIVDPLV